MLELFSAEICPFAQRTRALLIHLGVPFELREIDLRNKPDDFVAVSPTGKVPMLVDDDLKLYESQVINDYLAELHSWPDRYPSDVAWRARHKLAMKQWDDAILPPFYESMRDPSVLDEARAGIDAELDELEHTLEHTRARVPSLLSFHVATFWARWDWLRSLTPAAELVDARPGLRAWLDDAVAVEAVQQTLPARETIVDRYTRRYGPG